MNAISKRADHYVISYDAGEALPYGAAWFDDLDGGPHMHPFRYFLTKKEAHAAMRGHKYRTNPVCLCDDTVGA